jgi:hypothetical protein
VRENEFSKESRCQRATRDRIFLDIFRLPEGLRRHRSLISGMVMADRVGDRWHQQRAVTCWSRAKSGTGGPKFARLARRQRGLAKFLCDFKPPSQNII